MRHRIRLILLLGIVLMTLSAGAPTPQATAAGAIGNNCWKTITIDGSLADWPCSPTPSGTQSTHIIEDPFAEPTAGGSTINSDGINEASAFRWDNGSRTFLPSQKSADIKQVFMTWDSNYVYFAIEGPNQLYDDNDLMDLFIAIDTDNLTAPGTTLRSNWEQNNPFDFGYVPAAPAKKRVDFAGWSPDVFINIFRDQGAFNNPYADIRTKNSPNAPSFSMTYGSDWVAAYRDNDAGGGIHEVRIAWSQLGLVQNNNLGYIMNFAVYTTWNDEGYDVFDSAPGMGNGTVDEALGDRPADADHCAGGSPDPVTGLFDGPAGCPDGLGVGSTREPSSDNSIQDIDTIREYFQVNNVGLLNPTAVSVSGVQAKRLASAIQIEWVMLDEGGVTGYAVERRNGLAWQPVATRQPAGQPAPVRYLIRDDTAGHDQQTYRISATLADSTTKILAEVSVAALHVRYLPHIAHHPNSGPQNIDRSAGR